MGILLYNIIIVINDNLPVGEDGTFIVFDSQTFGIFVHSTFILSILHQVVSLLFQDCKASFCFSGCVENTTIITALESSLNYSNKLNMIIIQASGTILSSNECFLHLKQVMW